MVLFAVVNANYEFIYIHMGTNGRVSDAGIWKETGLCKRLESNKLNIPHPLYFSEIGCMPYVFIGDEAFPLMENLMKPYAQRNINVEQKIFNYRLCRARRVVENAFGIMATRFRLFLRPIAFDVDKIDTVVLACCALHNFLRKMSKKNYVTKSYVNHEGTHGGTWLYLVCGDKLENYKILNGLESIETIDHQTVVFQLNQSGIYLKSIIIVMKVYHFQKE